MSYKPTLLVLWTVVLTVTLASCAQPPAGTAPDDEPPQTEPASETQELISNIRSETEGPRAREIESLIEEQQKADAMASMQLQELADIQALSSSSGDDSELVALDSESREALIDARLERALHYPRIVNPLGTPEDHTTGALLVGSDAGSAEGLCTGILVGCDKFLTAAHCVSKRDANFDEILDSSTGRPSPAKPERFHVFLQHAGLFAVNDVAISNEYPGEDSSGFDGRGDIAVLTLTDEVENIQPTAINSHRRLQAGEVGKIIGFGRTGGTSTRGRFSDYGLKRAGAVLLEDCPGTQNDHSVCWTFNGTGSVTSNTCNGDSGGPLFVDRGRALGLVSGVTSGGLMADCEPRDSGGAFEPDQSNDTRVFEYLSFLHDNGVTDDPSRCGNLKPVGHEDIETSLLVGSLSPSSSVGTHRFTVDEFARRLVVTMNAEVGYDRTTQEFGDFNLSLARRQGPSWEAVCEEDGEGQFAACTTEDPKGGLYELRVTRRQGKGAYQATFVVFD